MLPVAPRVLDGSIQAWAKGVCEHILSFVRCVYLMSFRQDVGRVLVPEGDGAPACVGLTWGRSLGEGPGGGRW